MNLEISNNLKELVENAGAPVYIVGGYVRNAFSNLGKTDIDLSGPLIASALNLPKGAKVRMVNFRLGTSIISYKDEEYEYTPFRVEKYAPGGGHTPTEIAFTTDLVADARRRDFTANSIYYEINTGKVIDLFGGIADIERGVLRAYNPEAIFASDGLRILRLVRIAAETGFKLDGETAKVAMARSEYLSDISPERKAIELNRILAADTKYNIAGAHYRGLKLLQKFKILKYLIPQLEDCDKVAQNPQYHKYDVLEHTFQTVKFAPPEVRLAALFHDIGKPYCINLYNNMHGHEKISANVVKDALGQNGLKYSASVIDEVSRLCLYHMYDMDAKTSDSKIRLFIANNLDIIDKLVKLIKADKLATGMISEVDEEHRFTKVKGELLSDGTPISIADLKIDGNTLIELGFVGAQIGDELEELWRECVFIPALNREDWLVSHAKRKLFQLKK